MSGVDRHEPTGDGEGEKKEQRSFAMKKKVREGEWAGELGDKLEE